MRDGIVRGMSRPMRKIVVLLCLTAPFLAAPAGAQVTVDLHALDQQPTPATPQPMTPPPEHRAHPPPRRTTTAKPPAKPAEKRSEPEHATAKPGGPPPASAGTTTPEPAKPATPAPPPPTVGVAPPPAPIIPPPVPADAPMPAEPPPPISQTAGTTVDALPKNDGTGVRLDFAHGESDLSPNTAEAVKALVAAAPKTDDTTFNVMAYATGVPEDPSTARRLSLSRALSVRSALMAYGVPSTHIYVRALGALPGDGPQDRVDVMVMGANAAEPAPGAAHAVAGTP
jgi:outer membrane protein OmpA-like peptidoglycan-associated protein